MSFKKGHPKYGGKKKGFVSSQKQIVRDVIEKALGKTIPARIIELFETADPEVELKTLLDLMPYCYPKLQAIEMTPDQEQRDTNDNVNALVEKYKTLVRMNEEMK